MTEFDLVIRGGTVVTASDFARCDVGIRGETIVALADALPKASREIDARSKLVMPGGIDSHCHIEQRSAAGMVSADDFYSATVSAAFGGTTTVIPFAVQHRGDSLREVVRAYRECAEPKAIIDYAFHLIVSDPTPQVIGQDLPALVRDGYTSVKVFMTYDWFQLSDHEILDVLAVARREGAMVMVHAESYDVIRWLTRRLLDAGHRDPKYHAVAHARIAEGEATHRAISLAELLDVPLLIVHVSAKEAIDEIRAAQAKGLQIYGETCPQYLFLTAEDMDRPNMEGAMYCCSPPPRDAVAQAAVWRGIENGTFQVMSSDHAPFRFDETGKLRHGRDASFDQIAMGVPGLELRLPLLFSEGVRTGRIDQHRFVELAATNAARLYGLYPRKGTIAIGADADVAIWDPDREVTVTHDLVHDNAGYTPYVGMQLTGWPVTVLSRGRVVVDDGELDAERGSGKFLACDRPALARPLGRLVPELDPDRNFGAILL